MNSPKTCPECTQMLRQAMAACHGCGYTVQLVPEEEAMQRYLRRPSPGGLLWTQAYALGTRQYVWFVLSLIPIAGFVALGAMFLFGRRWSYKVGGWESFAQFKARQDLMDRIGYAWIGLLALLYVAARLNVFG